MMNEPQSWQGYAAPNPHVDHTVITSRAEKAEAERDELRGLLSHSMPWRPVLEMRQRAEKAEAELARIKAHGGNCGECDGWHGCCDAASRVRALCDRAEAAPNPYADQGAVAQVDVRDVRAALDGHTP